ncbi:hypothetical protein [Oceanobacter kriegii]|uniref:hypothetical protein n=1 Tax=Oceanobacter kriegii TaxID=64972 RepID=UPI0004295847|nr:hypothetical protein [Oceanobacter kriegii]
MSAIALVIAIALPIASIMAGMVYYGRNQQKKQSQRIQTRLIINKTAELREAVELLLNIDQGREIPPLIIDRVEELIQKAHEIWPGPKEKDEEDPFPEIDFDELRQRVDAEDREVRELFNSDREINYAKRQVAVVMQSLTSMVKRRVITKGNLDEYRRYLKLLMLKREVETFSHQGDLAADGGDVMSAGNYYKAARKMLIESDLTFPEKNDKIRELAQRNTALFNGGVAKQDKLSQAMESETPEEDPHGIPNGDEDAKRKY